MNKQKLVKITRVYWVDMDLIEDRYDEPEDAERANFIAEQIASDWFVEEWNAGEITGIDSFNVEYIKDVKDYTL